MIPLSGLFWDWGWALQFVCLSRARAAHVCGCFSFNCWLDQELGLPLIVAIFPSFSDLSCHFLGCHFILCQLFGAVLSWIPDGCVPWSCNPIPLPPSPPPFCSPFLLSPPATGWNKVLGALFIHFHGTRYTTRYSTVGPLRVVLFLQHKNGMCWFDVPQRNCHSM